VTGACHILPGRVSFDVRMTASAGVRRRIVKFFYGKEADWMALPGTPCALARGAIEVRPMDVA